VRGFDDKIHMSSRRYTILSLLAKKERVVKELAGILGLTAGAVYSTMEKLVYHSLVDKSAKRRGAFFVYSITDAGLEELKNKTRVIEHDSGYKTIRMFSEDRTYTKIFKPKTATRNGDGK